MVSGSSSSSMRRAASCANAGRHDRTALAIEEGQVEPQAQRTPRTGEEIAPKLCRSSTTKMTQCWSSSKSTTRAASRCVACRSKKVRTVDGKDVLVTTVFDLLCARFGVNRGFEGEYPSSYDDESFSYTPAWQERWTGIDRKTVIEFARNWAGHRAHHRWQVLHHHRCGDQPLVPQQPHVPVGDREPDLDRLRWQKWRRSQPLRRSGETRSGRAVGADRVCQGLARTTAFAERAVVALRAQRSVALRRQLHRLPSGPCRWFDRSRSHHGSPGPGGSPAGCRSSRSSIKNSIEVLAVRPARLVPRPSKRSSTTWSHSSSRASSSCPSPTRTRPRTGRGFGTSGAAMR